jgi:hypothetical protein
MLVGTNRSAATWCCMPVRGECYFPQGIPIPPLRPTKTRTGCDEKVACVLRIVGGSLVARCGTSLRLRRGRAGMRTLSLLTATHNSTPSPVRQPDSRTSTNARSHHVRCLHQALSSERQLAKLPPPNKLGSGLPQRSTLTTTSPPLASFYSQRIFSRTAAPPPEFYRRRLAAHVAAGEPAHAYGDVAGEALSDKCMLACLVP